jgi:hypothetical protein
LRSYVVPRPRKRSEVKRLMKLHYLVVPIEGAGEALVVISAVRRDPDANGPGQDVFAAIVSLPVYDLVGVSPFVLEEDFPTAYDLGYSDRFS